MLHRMTKILLCLVLLSTLESFPVHAAQPDHSKAAKAPPVVEDPGPWLLAGREGECAPISILSKKGPEYGDIQSPWQLAEKLRAAGHKAEIKEHTAGSRPAVELRVSDLELYVMFMKSDVCRKPANK